MTTLIDVARDESDLERGTIDALTKEAPDLISAWVAAQRLAAGTLRAAEDRAKATAIPLSRRARAAPARR